MTVEKIIMKEGVLNEKLAFFKLLSYMKSVYHIPQKIKTLTDKRKRRSIPLFNIVMPTLIFLMLQYRSFHTVFSAPESMGKRLRNCIRGRIPKVDAVSNLLSDIEPDELREIHEGTIDRMKRNRIWKNGTIGGYRVAAVDGVELFGSTKKSCPDCLTRKHGKEGTEYFHRSVVCMTVGEPPHIILGQEMLKPRDGNGKDEGELTGGKRLIQRLRKRHGHFADMIVADALYLNAPFINTVLGCRMEAVIRLKDEKRLIFKDAQGLFEKNAGKKEPFKRGRTEIEAWDLPGFEMDGAAKKVRVIRYHEKTTKKNGSIEENWMWLVTTDETADYQILWKIMHKRWDIEENGFHQLKTYYHAKHCYCHAAIETIFYLMIIAFHMRELYLYRRIRGFKNSGITYISANRIFQDDLQIKTMHKVLYNKGG